MAQVTLQIGDRTHNVSCAAGGEARLEALGAMLAERWPTARRAAGTGGTERELLLIALMLADDLDEAVNAPPPEAIADTKTLAAIAARLENLADTLEADGVST